MTKQRDSAIIAGKVDATKSPTCTIACKLPNGLVLQIATRVNISEQVMGGGTRDVPQYRFAGKQITIHGNSAPHGVAPVAMMTHGFALTQNVPSDFWNLWLEQNSEHAAVKNNLIWAIGSTESAMDAAKDARDQRSGLERIDRNNLPKVGKVGKAELTAMD